MKTIKYRGKLYVKVAASGAFTANVQRLFKLQDQMQDIIQQMKGKIHYRVRGQGMSKGPGMPSPGEESFLTPEQKQQAEKMEQELEQLRRRIVALLTHTMTQAAEQLDEFMGFTA